MRNKGFILYCVVLVSLLHCYLSSMTQKQCDETCRAGDQQLTAVGVKHMMSSSAEHNVYHSYGDRHRVISIANSFHTF